MNSNYHNNQDEETHHGHLIHLIFFLVFIIIWTLDSFVFKFSTILAHYIPLLIRILLSVGVLIPALVLWALSHIALFGKLFNPERHKPEGLVTTGIFAYIRNPIYLGNLLVLLSFILLTISLISFALWIIIFFLFNRQAAEEEQNLQELYGEEYIAYKKRVRRWI